MHDCSRRRAHRPRATYRTRPTLLLTPSLAALVTACVSPDRVAGPAHLAPPLATQPAAAAAAVVAGPEAAALGATDGAGQRHGAAAATRRRLERAAAGLLYTSESDAPFAYVDLPTRARPPLDEAAFRAAAGIAPGEPVETRTLDAFFARHIERVDPGDAVAVALVPRYVRLKRVLQRSLPGATVFRVGTVLIRCYVVGVDGRGHVVGLTTTAVET